MLYTSGGEGNQKVEFGLIAKDNISKEFNHIMTFKILSMRERIYIHYLDSTNEITIFEIMKMKEAKNTNAPGVDPVSVYEYIAVFSPGQEPDVLVSWEEIKTLEA